MISTSATSTAATSTAATSTGTSGSGTPALGTAATGTPAPGTAATGTPAPGTAATGTPAPGTAATGTPAPGTAATGTAATDVPARPRRALAAVGLAVVLGLGWGVATSYLQTVLPDPVAGLANAVSPWLVVPFVVGARSGSRRTAALAGLLGCVLQVVGYYATSSVRGYGLSASTIALWCATGVVGGPVFGVAGHLWRTATGRLRGAGGALLVAVWACEGVVSYAVRLGYYDDAAVFAGVALLLLLTVGRRPGPFTATLRWLAVALPAGALGMVLVDVLIQALA